MSAARCVLILVIGSLVALVGCGAKPPPANLPTVYKVQGKVLDAAGQPVSGGTLQFESLAAQNMVAIGEVQPDGTFEIRTMVDGHKLSGAVAGQQRVTYIPASTQAPGGTGPVVLKQTLEVKPQDNIDITLQL